MMDAQSENDEHGIVCFKTLKGPSPVGRFLYNEPKLCATQASHVRSSTC